MMARNKDDLDRFMDYDIYIPTRTLYMGSKTHSADDQEAGVNYQMAERIIKNLHFLDQTPDKPINIIMNNIGGCTYHGLGIYDAIASCNNYVTIRVVAHAMSMGAIILQAADHRVIHENSRIMIHSGELHIGGHSKMVRNWLNDSDKLDAEMQAILLKRIREKNPTYKLKTLQECLPFDKIILADEAVEFGLADEVIRNAI